MAIVERWPLVEVRLSLKGQRLFSVWDLRSGPNGRVMECERGGLFSFSPLVHAGKCILEISPFILKKISGYLMSYLAGTGVIITSGVSTAVAAVAAVQAACDIEEFPRPHIMLCKGPRMYIKHS